MQSLRILVALCLFAPARVLSEDSLTMIERALAEQYSSIHSAEVTFRVRHNVSNLSPEIKARVPEFSSWEWLQSGTKRLIRKESERLTDGQMNLVWYSFDGQRAFEMMCWQTDGTRPQTIRITQSINPLYHMRAYPEWMWGLNALGCDTPVLDWLKRRTPDKVRDLGLDAIDGHECRKVEFDNVPVQGLYGTRAYVWFDAEADWLPRRIAYSPLRYFEIARRQMESNPTNMEPIRMTVEPGEVTHMHEVLSFMQVDDPLLERKRWFPKSKKMAPGLPGGADGSDFEVETVVLNRPIDSSRFVPVPVPGTQTEDYTTGGELRRTIHGGEEGLIVHRELTRAQSVEARTEQQSTVATETSRKSTSSSDRPAPDARPKRTGWWPVIAAAGLLLFAVLFRKWRVSRS